MAVRGGLGLFLTSVVLAMAFAGFFGGVDSYNRPPMRKTLVVGNLEDDLDAVSPQQVRLINLIMYSLNSIINI